MSANGGQIVVDFTIDNGKAIVAVKQAGQTLQSLKSTLDSTAASVKKLETHNDSLGRKFRDIVLTMGNLRFVAMDVNDVFLRLPMAILKSAGELEKMQVLMQGLSKELTKAGKIAEGQKSFDFVTNMAKNAPFELKALADSFVKFKVAGIDPTNGSLQALVDSVAKFGGTGETLKRASVAIQQMAGKGVVSMEELRQQLGEAVPTAMQDMADAMGMSMGDLANTVSKGTLAAGPALDKMLLRMKVNNAGAAKDMMQTWVGMTERLKTEMALMAQTISKSDFGKAANEAVQKLIDALGSEEAKRFADTIGTELGEAVRTIVKFVEILIEYRSEIKLAAEAWIAYKLATTFLGPMVQSMVDGTRKVADSYRSQMAAANQAAAAQRAAALEVAAGMRAEAVAAEQRSLAVIASKEREVIAHSRAVDAMLAKQVVLNNALANRRGSEVIVPAMAGLPGLAGAQGVATVTKAQKDLTDQIAKQQAVSTAARAELNALAYAHNGLANNVITTTTSMKAMEGATVAASGAQRAMALGAGALRAGLALIGGGVGLVTIALIAGIAMWGKWARAAEEAQARKRRAEKKLSTQEDVDTTNEELAKAKSDLEKLKAVKPGNLSDTAGGAATGGRVRQATLKDIENQQRTLDNASKKVEELERTRSMQLVSLRESNARDEAEGMRKQSETVLGAIGESTEKELNESRARQAKLTANDKKTVADRKVETDKQTQLTINMKRAQNVALQKEFDSLAQKLDEGDNKTVGGTAAALRRKELGEQLKQNSDEIVAMIAAEERKIEIVAKDGKGKAKAKPIGYDKVDSLIGGLAGQKAELQAEIDSFNATMGIVDKGLAAAAKLDAQAKAGKFKHRGEDGKTVTDISPEELAKAKALARDVAEMQTAMQLAERIAAQGRDIEGDYKAAVAILADPLGSIKVADRGKTGAFEDMLNKTGADMDKVAARMGKTREQFEADIGKIRSELATIDLAKPVADMAEQTARTNIEIIVNDRDRTSAQLRYDSDLYVSRMRSLIEYQKAHGASTEAIQAAELALANWQIANAASITEKMKTPMQRLVDQWADSTTQMQNATAGWAQQGVDAFVNFAKTGKFEWNSLVTDVLAGLLKIQLQKQLAGLMGGGGGTGGSDFLGSIVKGIAGYFGSGSGSGVGVAGSAAAVGSSANFADGGIMSSLGSLPLKKYAAGGIATSPQLALFGEGAHNEAYVPLPDGRSIPVTMKSQGEGAAASGGAPAVTVNVINQTSQPVSAQQGTPRFDGKQMILDVVLSAASSPGPFRDQMQGAFSK